MAFVGSGGSFATAVLYSGFDAGIANGTWGEIDLTFTVGVGSTAINGTVFSLAVNTSATKELVTTGINLFLLSLVAASSFSSCSIANLTCEKTGTTTYFPLTEGSGRDIASYIDGVATVIPNAIVGTLTNVWANRTNGQVAHTYPEATRAIIVRDTKLTNGSDKYFATSSPLTGADLASAEEFVS
jgi:hypothetical protein